MDIEFEIACQECDIKKINELVTLVDKDEINTSFYRACYSGRYQIVEILLDYINVVDERCIRTAFIPVFDDPYLKTIELLLNSGKCVEVDNIHIGSNASYYFTERARSLLNDYMFRLDGKIYNENIIG